ncbi:MAG: nucleotide-diphospho-sugar transferase [Ignavibacteriota bacterium]|nr:nucleotide-diphospho-sugar transferase [Ignavibacteriota bacterium]
MKSERFDIPILFLIFNRPDTTEKVFEKIREIKPKYFYVSADGARENKPGEYEKCELAKSVLKKVDWECEVNVNFSEINLGCKEGVTKGINWFFENTEYGIILEDDCLPDISFFNFCKVMLERYKDDKRVMHIGGVNFQDTNKRGNKSYYYSRFCHVWGWATWKDRWAKYDVNMAGYNDDKYYSISESIIKDKEIIDYYKRLLDTVRDNKLDTWDFQWVWTVWKNDGVSIIPNVNLVKNIGFGEEATHTVSTSSKISELSTGRITEFDFNDSIEPDAEADRYTYYHKIRKSKFEKLTEVIKKLLK